MYLRLGTPGLDLNCGDYYFIAVAIDAQRLRNI